MAGAASSPTLSQRIQYHVAKALAGLPPGVQVRLSGKPPVQIDGDTLAPEVQLTLALLERRHLPSPETLTPEQARNARRDLAAVYAGKPVAVGAVRDLEIDAGVSLRARHYAPA